MPNPFSLRMSDELRKLMELAAKDANVTLASLIVRACWQYLDQPSVAIINPAYPDRFSDSYPLPTAPKALAEEY